jgi:hypothetical protein
MLYKISEDLKLKKPPFLNEIQAVSIESVPLSKSLNTHEAPFKTPPSTSNKTLATTKSAISSATTKKTIPNSQQSHVLSPQAIAKAKLLAKSQSYTNTHFNSKFGSKFN